MARARNIKPSFFTNEQLADSCPLGRLLFIGLWTLADYKGDIEWKEKTIKIQILPWDDCDIKKLAINLDKSGLIRFYSVQDKIYIHVVNFAKHQNPHKNERDKGSYIPCFSDEHRQVIDLKGLAIYLDLSGLERNSSHSNPADSLLLNPYSLNPVIPESQQVAQQDKPAKKIARRLPDDWKPTREYWNEALLINKDLTQEWFVLVAHKFKDYWIAKSGKDATKADWLATWRNWVRREVENGSNKQLAGSGGRKEKVSHADRVREEARVAIARIDAEDGIAPVHENGGLVREQGGESGLDYLF